MKKLVFALAMVLMLLPAVGSDANTEETQTLNGSYKWDQGDSEGALEAVFTPLTEDTWGVSFYFKFRGKPHTYTGTATGSLTDGPLSGEVKTENKRRTFSFEGTMKEGVFSGTHAELDEDEQYQTGTLTLR